MEYNIAMSVVPTEDKTLMTSILANRALVLNKVKLPKNAIDVRFSLVVKLLYYSKCPSVINGIGKTLIYRLILNIEVCFLAYT